MNWRNNHMRRSAASRLHDHASEHGEFFARKARCPLFKFELFNDWGGRGYDDSVPGEVTKTRPSARGEDYMIPYMVGKLAPN